MTNLQQLRENWENGSEEILVLGNTERGPFRTLSKKGEDYSVVEYSKKGEEWQGSLVNRGGNLKELTLSLLPKTKK